MNWGVEAEIKKYFIEQNGAPVSPAEVGRAVGKQCREKASSWACWRLRQLVADGWLYQRRERGPYYMTEKAKASRPRGSDDSEGVE